MPLLMPISSSHNYCIRYIVTFFIKNVKKIVKTKMIIYSNVYTLRIINNIYCNLSIIILILIKKIGNANVKTLQNMLWVTVQIGGSKVYVPVNLYILGFPFLYIC
jgi:hypothetical protein